MASLAWWLWWSLPWMMAPLESDALERYEKRCEDEQHAWCVQQGVAWLRSNDTTLSTTQRQRITARLAGAYVALGREKEAHAIVIEMLRRDACVPMIPGLQGEARRVFLAARKQILRADVGGPMISHTPMDTVTASREPVLTAKVTDDMKVLRVEAYVRYRPKAAWERLSMEPMGEDRYRVGLSAEQIQQSKYVAYYIVASDCAGNRSYAAGSEVSPRVLELEGKGPSPLLIAGGALIAVGAGLMIAGGVFFLRSNEGIERWNNTINLEESEVIREQIVLDYSLGWGGLSLGSLLFGAGVAMLVAPMFRPKPKDPDTSNTTTSERNITASGRRSPCVSAHQHRNKAHGGAFPQSLGGVQTSASSCGVRLIDLR